MVMNTLLKEEDRVITQKLEALSSTIKLAFSEIHDEFQEHLESINENTTEIQSNYTYLCELDNKIAKLNERIDEIHLILANLTAEKKKKKQNLIK